MTNYKGFQINRLFEIFKNGKQVFTAFWQRSPTLYQAQQLIDSSLKLKAMPDKQAALKKLTEDCCELENGTEDAEKFIQQLNDYYENQNNLS